MQTKSAIYSAISALVMVASAYCQTSEPETIEKPALLRELYAEPDTLTKNPKSPSLQIVVKRVLDNHPDLLASRASIIGAQGKLVQAGKGENPVLSLDIENFGRNSTSGIGEITVGVEKDFQLWGKRSLHKQSVTSEISASEESYRSSLLDLYYQTGIAFYNVIASVTKIENAREGVTIAQNIREVAAKKFTEGAVPEVDVLRAQEAEFEARIELESAASNYSRDQQMLVSLWGGEAPIDSVSGSLRWWLGLGISGSLESLITNHPDFRTLEYERDVRNSELQRSRIEPRPNLTLGAGYRRLIDDNDNAFLVWTSLPLPFSNRNQGNIATAGAAIAETEAHILSYKRHSLSALRSQLSLLDTYSQKVIQIESTLLPMAQRAMAATDAAYRLGSLPYLNVLQARQDYVNLKQRLTDILFQGVQTALAIERLTGHRLTAIGSR